MLGGDLVCAAAGELVEATTARSIKVLETVVLFMTQFLETGSMCEIFS